MPDIDPTDHALATIASILERPEPAREAEEPTIDVEAILADPVPPPLPSFDEPEQSFDEQPLIDDERILVNEQPLAPEQPDADGYSKVGPGPMAALRFKWTVQRGDDGQFYVHETIGEYSTPVVSGPLSSEAAVRLVDEREADAHHRFEVLRSEISGRGALADFVRKGEA
ncbi:hypothetical protein JQ596_29495 [Bradyrhizobium manausense]|uniref:hypothetical protein n=1 Tax=Bradyrhizobium TaxID=374 RepID=UPI001BADBA2C|nr:MULTISPECIES: hypothetical protein [Bradyrhizobium]MBR0829675.1 hypothetical protein [Bradyrhizobium manausense]UVO25295.1 hypothetical protein KUF59_22030 [Bradyrhizobium arachidis]